MVYLEHQSVYENTSLDLSYPNELGCKTLSRIPVLHWDAGSFKLSMELLWLQPSLVELKKKREIVIVLSGNCAGNQRDSPQVPKGVVLGCITYADTESRCSEASHAELKTEQNQWHGARILATRWGPSPENMTFISTYSKHRGLTRVLLGNTPPPQILSEIQRSFFLLVCRGL